MIPFKGENFPTVPSTIMRSLEYSSIEVLAIFTGLIGYVEQSASIANFQISSYFYRIPNGISIASTSLIGNCLGSRQHINARKYTVSAILIVIMVAFVTFKYIRKANIGCSVS